MRYPWPPQLPVVQLRLARRTARLGALVEFYHHGLGLPIIYQYRGHAGYDGVMLGLPGRDYHLELVSRGEDPLASAPDPDDLLVLYLADRRVRDLAVARLAAMGHAPEAPRNPYWARDGVTVADPDGWRVVLMHTHGFGPDVDATTHF